MFGPRITTVFKSRWNAVFWSLGILTTAYCSVPSPEQDKGAVEKIGESAARKLAGTSQERGEHPHANPWAKDPD
jgi:hypothetical protein